MIIGIGTDIVEIKRIKSVLNRFGNKFKNRCFTDDEIIKSDLNVNIVNSYAKIFSAKEAFVKALGTGFSKGIYWKDIYIYNEKSGKPNIRVYGNIRKKIDDLTNHNYKIDVSISDEKEYAIANVIISKKNG